MVQLFNSKCNKIILSGILPRSSLPTAFYNWPFTIDNCLSPFVQRKVSISSTAGMTYIINIIFFKNDGQHLNPVGVARLGRLLSNKLLYFKIKKQPAASHSLDHVRNTSLGETNVFNFFKNFMLKA